MANAVSFGWRFIEAVPVLPSTVSTVDSVVVLAGSSGSFPELHGGWLRDLDRVRAAAGARTLADRVRARPAVSNHQFRIAVPRPRRRSGDELPDVRAVRVPRPGETGSQTIEVRLFWAGMQLIADTRERIPAARAIECAFRRACAAGFYARSAGVAEHVISESLADIAELAELLITARDSRVAVTVSVGGGHDDDRAEAAGFLASGLPSTVTIEMRERE